MVKATGISCSLNEAFAVVHTGVSNGRRGVALRRRRNVRRPLESNSGGTVDFLNGRLCIKIHEMPGSAQQI